MEIKQWQSFKTDFNKTKHFSLTESLFFIKNINYIDHKLVKVRVAEKFWQYIKPKVT